MVVAEPVVAVREDPRAGTHAQKSGALQWALDPDKRGSKLGEPGEDGHICEFGTGRVRVQGQRRLGAGAERDTAPITLVLLCVEMRRPFTGRDGRDIRAKRVGVEDE